MSTRRNLLGAVPLAVRLPTVLLAAVLLAPGFPGELGWTAAGEARHDPAARVAVEDGHLTVEARDVPLADLLGLIGERAGLRVTVWGGVGPLVTDAFADLPLEEGIARLVRGHALVLTYGPALGGTGETAVHEVRVYVAEAEAPAPPPATPAKKAANPAARKAKEARASPLGDLPVRARQGDEAAAAALAQLLLRDPDPVVRSRAAAALGRAGASDAEPVLSVALNDAEPSVRLQATRALARLEGVEATQALSAVLLGDTEPRVRREAARALRALGADDARWALELAASDPDPSVRRAAAGTPRAPKGGHPR